MIERMVYIDAYNVFHCIAYLRINTECSHWLEGVFPFDIDIDADAMCTGIALPEAIARKDEQLVRTCSAVVANLTPFRSPSSLSWSLG